MNVKCWLCGRAKTILLGFDPLYECNDCYEATYVRDSGECCPCPECREAWTHEYGGTT